MTIAQLMATLLDRKPMWEYGIPTHTMGSLWQRQFDWATETFGEGRRDKGIIAHLRAEIDELEASPDDIVEAVDLIFLAADHAMRVLASKGDPEPGLTLEAAWLAKFEKNKKRQFKKVGPDEPSFHVKGIHD